MLSCLVMMRDLNSEGSTRYLYLFLSPSVSTFHEVDVFLEVMDSCFSCSLSKQNGSYAIAPEPGHGCQDMLGYRIVTFIMYLSLCRGRIKYEMKDH